MSESAPQSAGNLPIRLVRDHTRRWRQNQFVYPVISRRSQGLSVGINLNPDTACNFDCIYCQVDRSRPDRGARVDLDVLRAELDTLLASAVSGEFFEDPKFAHLPSSMRAIRDIAFSGDGEPTTCPVFPQAVNLVADLKARHRLDRARIVLITDACYLKTERVRRALEVMDANQGEIWAKLDAGTEDYFRRICRPNANLSEVLENILDAARIRPLVIQSLWMNVDGTPPPDREVQAFVDRLQEIQHAGGRLKLVQVYTVARKPAEEFVSPLDRDRVEHIADLVRTGTGVPTEAYFAPEDSTA